MGSGRNNVPGMRKNAKPPHPGPSPMGEREFMDMTNDEQRDTLNHELKMWDFEGLNVQAVTHNVFNMDCQLQALVRYIIKELGGDEDTMNRYYRDMAYTKLTTIRQQARKTGPGIILPGGDIQL